MFTQMSAKQGIKKFNKRDVSAIVKYDKEIHDINTFVRVCPEDLTTKQKQYALREITLIK